MNPRAYTARGARASSVQVTEVAPGGDGVPDTLLQLPRLGETAVRAPIPERGAIELDAEGAGDVRGREGDLLELVGEGAEQLLGEPAGAEGSATRRGGCPAEAGSLRRSSLRMLANTRKLARGSVSRSPSISAIFLFAFKVFDSNLLLLRFGPI